MFKKFILPLVLVYSLSSTAQNEEILAGLTVAVENNLYTSKTEVLNIHYLEYLYYVKRDSSKSFYESQIIQFPVADTIYTEQNYLRNPLTRRYPVIYANYNQAKNYCAWFKRALAKNLAVKENTEPTQYSSLDVRLPTMEEWIKLAIKYDYDLEQTGWVENISDSPLEKKDLRKIKRKHKLNIGKKEYYNKLKVFIENNPIYMLENLKYKGELNYLGFALNINQPWSRDNSEKLLNIPYDLRGNLSEMTSTKGIARVVIGRPNLMK